MMEETAAPANRPHRAITEQRAGDWLQVLGNAAWCKWNAPGRRRRRRRRNRDGSRSRTACGFTCDFTSGCCNVELSSQSERHSHATSVWFARHNGSLSKDQTLKRTNVQTAKSRKTPTLILTLNSNVYWSYIGLLDVRPFQLSAFSAAPWHRRLINQAEYSTITRRRPGRIQNVWYRMNRRPRHPEGSITERIFLPLEKFLNSFMHMPAFSAISAEKSDVFKMSNSN